MNIRVISPAGHTDAAIIDAGIATLRAWGHDVTVGAHAYGRRGRYAGSVDERVDDLLCALRDDDVDIIWCSRGGYGCMQLLDYVPVETVAAAGRPVVGYSDVTALHALWQRAGVASLHAPMMRHLASDAECRRGCTAALRVAIDRLSGLLDTDAARNGSLQASIASPARRRSLDLLPDTRVTAPVVGGNLAVISALHATPYDFCYDGRILFVEDIGESPYKVDRMMQTLRLAGVLDRIAGLLVGQFTDYVPDPDQQIEQSIHAMLAPYHVPVRFDVAIGHVDDNFPVVEGARLTI